MRLLALVLGLTTGLKPQPTRQELLRGAAASALLAPVPPARAEEFKDVAPVREGRGAPAGGATRHRLDCGGAGRGGPEEEAPVRGREELPGGPDHISPRA